MKEGWSLAFSTNIGRWIVFDCAEEDLLYEAAFQNLHSDWGGCGCDSYLLAMLLGHYEEGMSAKISLQALAPDRPAEHNKTFKYAYT